ncbi:hypothetical protein BOSE62_50024 [Bosea sp. 62]|nr:hypothetical protein BOSE46_110191 [Bosea sp. 46]CAD5258656.1 hypothetical protein BOSE21B_110235 [Bosea sp. 21B]CAD5282236.1 hypothetical protein BOSE7B_40980 [Bosea sp. 7B]VVT51858.1 hypothetical protein BOS5A_110473 [Bosea sp. EC-HK365B]VXB42069.1 hypothetical protein BOSE29B_110190 [Bosea sp. 29B]VXB85759.1 hypothetical protein BOSE125_150339 [Bosea sp. 125]VXC55786.1 hypothetical protein BOSE62_50024 [Bosea sp. 62]VXC87581.1 hypothetical protein BOSE127_70024 [Bosea sp. 127]
MHEFQWRSTVLTHCRGWPGMPVNATSETETGPEEPVVDQMSPQPTITSGAGRLVATAAYPRERGGMLAPGAVVQPPGTPCVLT